MNLTDDELLMDVRSVFDIAGIYGEEAPYSAVCFETVLGKQGQAVTTGKGDKGIILIEI